MKPVIIAGAGLSGLAAGVLLSSRGVPVTVFEQKQFAGGRAYSFPDPRTGETVDNGQHVLIAGYDATLGLLELIGTRRLVRVQSRPRLFFHHPERGFRSLSLPPLPSPLHLLWGLLTSGLCTVCDRVRLLRAGMSLLNTDPAFEEELSGKTVAQWLELTGQSAETRRSLWEPLAIATMNEHCSTASATLFIHSIQKAFLHHWRSSAFAVPTVGLSQVFAEPAIEFIRGGGGQVHCGLGVKEPIVRNGIVDGVRLDDGSEREAAGVILAVPSHRVRAALPSELRESGFLSSVELIPLSPIVSIHLWFASDFMGAEEMVGIIGRRIQWVFNRRAILGSADGISRNLAGGHICAVISAAREFVTMSNDGLVSVAIEDLCDVYGDSAASPTSSLVVREKRATFSSSPMTEKLRPGNATPIPNLFLAGDWTATGYPATIEGAIVSARRSTVMMEGWIRRRDRSLSV